MSLGVAAFLDRDGVLNARPPEHDYVRAVEDLVLLPGVGEAVRALAAAGYQLVVVSNQRGVARGLVTWETLDAIERVLLVEIGEPVAFYYCTHETAEGCDCRKPSPGMLLRAAAELELDLERSVTIGDAETDVDAGRAAGTRTIRIGPPDVRTAADARAADLPGAVELVVGRTAG